MAQRPLCNDVSKELAGYDDAVGLTENRKEGAEGAGESEREREMSRFLEVILLRF